MCCVDLTVLVRLEDHCDGQCSILLAMNCRSKMCETLIAAQVMGESRSYSPGE
jgi:hypothetical protein